MRRRTKAKSKMGTEGRIEMQRLWKGNRYLWEESRGKKKKKKRKRKGKSV